MKLKSWVKISLGIIVAFLIFWLGQNWGTIKMPSFGDKPVVEDLSNCQNVYTDAAGDKRCADKK